MQMQAILEQNPDAKVMAISSSAHQGLTEVLRELWRIIEASRKAEEPVEEETEEEEDIPVITLEVKEQKRRARHQKYQLGERNSIQQLDPQVDYSDDDPEY
jgi:hypothetical protein